MGKIMDIEIDVPLPRCGHGQQRSLTTIVGDVGDVGDSRQHPHSQMFHGAGIFTYHLVI